MKQKAGDTQREWNVFQEAWRTIPEDYLKQLQESMAKRIQAIRK